MKTSRSSKTAELKVVERVDGILASRAFDYLHGKVAILVKAPKGEAEAASTSAKHRSR